MPVIGMMCLSLVSCGGGSKQVVAESYYSHPKNQLPVDDNPYGKEVQLSEAERYAQLAPSKRAAGTGSSFKKSLARQMAEAEARRVMSDAMGTAVLSALKTNGIEVEKYAGGYDDAQMASEASSRTNSLVSVQSFNTISSAVVVKESLFYNAKNRRYTSIVCLECQHEPQEMVKKVVKEVRQRISDEDREKMDFHMDEFEKEVENNFMKNMSKTPDNE